MYVKKSLRRKHNLHCTTPVLGPTGWRPDPRTGCLMSFLYWVYDHTCNFVFDFGYVGVTEEPPKRFRNLLSTGTVPRDAKQVILFEGTRGGCLLRENQLRPWPNIGWKQRPWRESTISSEIWLCYYWRHVQGLLAKVAAACPGQSSASAFWALVLRPHQHGGSGRVEAGLARVGRAPFPLRILRDVSPSPTVRLPVCRVARRNAADAEGTYCGRWQFSLCNPN